MNPSTPAPSPQPAPNPVLTQDQTREAILDYVRGGERTHAELQAFVGSLNSKHGAYELSRLQNARVIRGRVKSGAIKPNGTITDFEVTYYVV